jgi:hypothetical protein
MSYQAIYDAAVQQFDISHLTQQASAVLTGLENEYLRPSVMFRPRVTLDGNKWCALYGENLQEGVCGFGDWPDAAMRDFDREWTRK